MRLRMASGMLRVRNMMRLVAAPINSSELNDININLDCIEELFALKKNYLKCKTFIVSLKWEFVQKLLAKSDGS